MKKSHLIAGATLVLGGALALGIAFLNAADEGKIQDFTACSKDGKTAVLSAAIFGAAVGNPSLPEVTDSVWKKTAAEMDGDQLAAPEGYKMFLKNFSAMNGRELTGDTDMQINGRPVVTGAPGSCQP